MPLAPMTVAQTRGRRSQRDSGRRTSRTRPINHRAFVARANVGGDMFEIASPGRPTIEIGYGPSVVSATVATRPPAVSASASRRPPRDSAPS
jgi:hypothetical protein